MHEQTHGLQKLGELLRKKREDLGLSLKHISEATKIRLDYLEALEDGNYSILPADVYTKGFVRNYSLYIGINPKITLALFRRENIKDKKSKTVINKLKKDAAAKMNFRITPERLAIFGGGLLVLLFIIYIITRVSSVVREPDFQIESPIVISAGETQVYKTEEESVNIRGNLEVGSTLTINDAEVDTKNLEIFEIPEVRLKEGENIFVLKAKSQFGIESIIILRVVREIKDSETVPTPSVGTTNQPISDMLIEMIIGPREANVVVVIDGVEKQNWVEAADTVKTFKAKSSLKIQTPRPDSVRIAINGKEQQINTTEVIEWNLIDGQVVRKN